MGPVLPFGLSSGRQESEGYSCSTQYEWHQLALRQREQVTREQARCGAALNNHTSSRVEDSMVATEIGHQSRQYDYRRYGGESVNDPFFSHPSKAPDTKGLDVTFLPDDAETEKKIDKRNQSLDQAGLLELNRRRCITSPRFGVNSYPLEDEIGAYHDQGRASGHAQTSSHRTERRVSSLDGAHDYAKGADGHMPATAILPSKVLPSNQGSSTQNRQYPEDRHLPTEVSFPGVFFSEIDKEKHRSYMETFRTCKNNQGHCSKDPSRREEGGRSHTKKPFEDFHTIHHEQLEFSPREDFYGRLDSSRNCRSACNGKKPKKPKKKCAKQSFQKKRSDGAFASRYGSNSHRKRQGDQLVGQLVKKKMAYENQSKELSYPNEQDKQSYPRHKFHHGGSDVIRNDNQEGNIETTKELGQNGAKGISHSKKTIPTAAACSGSPKSEENSNVLNPKYSSKTIDSSNAPKQSDVSSNMKLESDKLPSIVDFTKRTRDMKAEEVFKDKQGHPPDTHMEIGVHTEESDSTSPSQVLRDCLTLWKRVKKNRGIKAEKNRQADKKWIKQTSKISHDRRVRNGRHAAGSSESDEEESDDSVTQSAFVSSENNINDRPSENLERCRGVLSSREVQKHVEGRANRKLAQPFRCLNGSNCNNNLQNTMAEKGLMCNVELPSEVNSGKITQQEEQDKLSCCLNGCSDASKVEQDTDSHPDSCVSQKVSQQVATYDPLDARRKYKLVASYEIKNILEGDGTKWGEQRTSLSTVPLMLDKKTTAFCSTHDDNVQVNASECSNQDCGSTAPLSATTLAEATANKFLEKPFNYRDKNNSFKGSDCRDIQWDAMNSSILRNKQECPEPADSENDMIKKETGEDYQPSQALEVTSNQKISHQFDPGSKNPSAPRRADWTCSLIPDLNVLPTMTTDEELKASEEVIYQVNGHGSKPQNSSKSLSTPFSGSTLQEGQFKQSEPNELTRGISEREGANRFQLSSSNSEQPQLSAVETSSTSVDLFKCALCEFIRNIIKPLWEDGLLSREVHKIIVKKAVDKVTAALGLKVPLTETDIRKYFSEESQNLEKFVQGYLDFYLGKEVLKRTVPDNSKQSCKTLCS